MEEPITGVAGCSSPNGPAVWILAQRLHKHVAVEEATSSKKLVSRQVEDRKRFPPERVPFATLECLTFAQQNDPIIKRTSSENVPFSCAGVPPDQGRQHETTEEPPVEDLPPGRPNERVVAFALSSFTL
ncbi:unnamed protein product [Pleuronectes platessa]|uniref:Uncharacterized protein n=1 Tax=Pleuronectes platessa TaxID=8262 RepID=A0A9N7VLN5_PLEPL|nr:unnamed protein product [Pleuronectes platessa]